MTAEVAILNKSSVALAADSAMTIPDTGKVYPTNKLFAMSKFQPVGIMMYNNSEFMGVPWETLVKMYRSHLGTASKPTVSCYLRDFLVFISNEAICTAQQQTANLSRIANDVCRHVARIHRRNVDTDHRINDTDGLLRTIDETASLIATFKVVESMSSLERSDLIADHQIDIRRTAEHYFQGCNIDAMVVKSLGALINRFITSDRLSSDYSGIVVAGFGESEICPTLIEARTDGMIAGTLKEGTIQTRDLGRQGADAAVVPFAQREMIDRFMLGADPKLLDYLRAYVPRIAWKSIETAFGPLTDDQRTGIWTIFQSHVDDFHAAVRELQKSRFVDPIIDVVRHLPKEELADMAESLIGLTSLKRRVSSEMESVGGPVDVALISKGDGFIWIKRKHYFDASLNVDYANRQSVLAQNQHRSN